MTLRRQQTSTLARLHNLSVRAQKPTLLASSDDDESHLIRNGLVGAGVVGTGYAGYKAHNAIQNERRWMTALKPGFIDKTGFQQYRGAAGSLVKDVLDAAKKTRVGQLAQEGTQYLKGTKAGALAGKLSNAWKAGAKAFRLSAGERVFELAARIEGGRQF